MCIVKGASLEVPHENVLKFSPEHLGVGCYQPEVESLSDNSEFPLKMNLKSGTF